MRRVFICIILSIALIAASIPCYAARQSELSLSARGAILIDMHEGCVLYEKNSRERMPMASTTKIVTALVASELLSPDAVIKIPHEAVGIEGSSVYLCEGELLTVRELLYALLLESANDAAVALAIASTGSVGRFADKCNEKALSLGLCDTNFTNPHGLYDENHYTTAYDLAMLSAEALKSELLGEIFKSKTAKIPYGVTNEQLNGEGTRTLKNHNKMLSLYEGSIGMKTGFTKKSGRCLVSAAERDGLTLIAVTLNAPDDWRDHTAMLDYGFERYEYKTIYGAMEFSYDFPISNAECEFVSAKNLTDIKILLPKESQNVSTTVEAHFRFAIAPVGSGQIMGKLCVYANGKAYCSTLVSTEAISAKKEKFSFLK